MSDRPTQMAGWLVDQYRALAEQSHRQADNYRDEAAAPTHWVQRTQAEHMAQWCEGAARAYEHAAEMLAREYGVTIEAAIAADGEVET